MRAHLTWRWWTAAEGRYTFTSVHELPPRAVIEGIVPVPSSPYPEGAAVASIKINGQECLPLPIPMEALHDVLGFVPGRLLSLPVPRSAEDVEIEIEPDRPEGYHLLVIVMQWPAGCGLGG